MPAIFSKFLKNVFCSENISGVSILIVLFCCMKYFRHVNTKRNSMKIEICNDSSKPKGTIGLNMTFLRSIARFLKITISGPCSQESGLLLLIASSIIGRTVCDVWMVTLTTKIESTIIFRQQSLFLKHLKHFIFITPIFALINNLLRLAINRLKLRVRSRLTDHFRQKYMRKFTFYQVVNLDARLKNVDQLLTDDIEKFSSSIVDLYSNIAKPLLDIIIFTAKLTSVLGKRGPSMLLLYLLVSGAALTRMRRPLTSMTMVEQQHEGEYRGLHSRLIAAAEEVAFYQGGPRESSVLADSFQRLEVHKETVMGFKFITGIMDNLFAKYVATGVGFYIVSRPFFRRDISDDSHTDQSEQLQRYYSTGRMMVKLAEALGRLVLSGRQASTLAGFSSRMQLLDTTLDSVAFSDFETEGDTHNKLHRLKDVIIKDNIIKFEDVPLITPSGEVLIEKLNFEVHSGSNVIIIGPNGCGKSSLFRILGGLWPQYGGRISKPDNCKLFYIPQKPYMTIGSLRDQFIYPQSQSDMCTAALDDSTILDIVAKVKLNYIVTREGGLDSVKDWSEVLSGGEKQRVAMARLFWHRPQFAILDECSSAVSADVEASMFELCRQLGITLFTVSHRQSLCRFHEFHLSLDGRGNYEFARNEDGFKISIS